MFVAMGIIQGGGGFPFLASPVYESFLSGKCTRIDVQVCDVPDWMQLIILNQVLYIIVLYCLCMCVCVCVCVWCSDDPLIIIT